MKMHLLALAAGTATLALTTTAFAQTTGGNEAYVNQQGDTGVEQNITINQSGRNGDVGFDGKPILQKGGGNNLAVDQSGDTNSVGGFGGAASGQSSQVGKSNNLRIDQNGGTRNGVIFTQKGDNNGRRAASVPPADRSPALFGAPVNYGVYPGAAWNYVSQSGGKANRISATENGDNNGLIILQNNGESNVAALTQKSNNGTLESGGVNLAYFSQSGGSNNTIRLSQLNSTGNTAGVSSFNLADIRQSGGNGNAVAGKTGAYAIQDGSGLDLFSQQTGSYNQLNVSQIAKNSRIESVQNGTGLSSIDKNLIVVDQKGELQKATFQQYGYGNTADVTQTAMLNISDVYQSGYKNSLTSTQDGTGSHYLLASQIGNDNTIRNTQVGFNQSAFIDQNGSFNTAINYQDGSSNRSYISQGASYNTANVLQSGSNNVATITQNRMR